MWFIVGIMRSFEMAHDPDRAANDQRDDQNAEGQRQHVVGVVRRRGEMQEENQMHADLRDRQRGERDRNGRRPDQVRVDDVKRCGREQRRQHEPKQIALDVLPDRVFVRLGKAGSDIAGIRTGRSSALSYQINDREQRHPDDVEHMPEQIEAEHPPQDVGAETLDENLRHHGAEPQQAGADVQAVASDHGKERRQKGAALRAGALLHQFGEIVRLQHQKGDARAGR